MPQKSRNSKVQHLVATKMTLRVRKSKKVYKPALALAMERLRYNLQLTQGEMAKRLNTSVHVYVKAKYTYRMDRQLAGRIERILNKYQFIPIKNPITRKEGQK